MTDPDVGGRALGFESTAMYGEESRNPKRIVPRATLAVVVGLGVLYTFVAWTVVAGNGAGAVDVAAGASPLDLFLAPARRLLGPWAGPRRPPHLGRRRHRCAGLLTTAGRSKGRGGRV
ncbi:hypothetical protein ACIBCA_01285 [Kitasatospora sp. NPDC051170]|uniref:hypothetical protein n=1 Tax=Kitasatospora sp. NPDC051170 TaxID=3364056 RepID=UPI00378DDF93